jgi:hypothetical protein
MLVAVMVSPASIRGPQYMDQALAAIHEADAERLPVSLEIGRYGEHVALFCRTHGRLRGTVQELIYAQYPECKIEAIPVSALSPQSGHRTWNRELRLVPDIFPIKRYSQFEDALNRTTADPLTAILSTVAREGADQLRGHVQIIIRPARDKARARAIRSLRRLACPFFRSHPRLAHLYATWARSPSVFARILSRTLGVCARKAPAERELTTSTARLHEREDDLQAASNKLAQHLFETRIIVAVSGPKELSNQARRKLSKIVGAVSQFSLPRLGVLRAVRVRRLRRSGFLMSTEEIATLWHPPTQTVRAPTLASVESRELEPPAVLPSPKTQPEIAVLGRVAFRSRRERFGILPDDRRRHVAILGKTGQGKTTLLHNLIASDIQAGNGIALIDPHGDLADSVLAAVPRHRTNDVVLFDAGDAGFPLSFNPLQSRTAEQRPLVASGVLSAFKKLYGDSWGPRLEHILRNALLALLEIPGSSLVSLLRLLGDGRYRKAIAERLSDPVVRSFWQREFAGMPPKLQAEAISPIQNKVGHFVSSPLLRNIVGQARSTLDIRSVMDSGQVLIVNLSKGRIGEDASTLLGSLLISSVQIAAMSRAELAETDRRDFYMYVDEFQNFATDSFATILSEARKYRLSLTIANQYLAQMDEPTADAVFGNVGTLIAFQVGARDAEVLAEQFGGDLTAQDLMRLPRYHAYARLLIDGHPSLPFSMQTLPPRASSQDTRRPDIIRRTSRHRYSRAAAEVESEIEKAIAVA